MSSSSSSNSSRRRLQWVMGESEPIERKYILGKRLGQPGQYGHARLATHRETKQVRAVKVIGKTRFQRCAELMTRFRAEFELMVQMDHPNIIKAYEWFEDRTNFYIIMEYCGGGELYDRIQSKKRYSERDAAIVISQIVSGLAYMHEKKIAHCDLKPDNFLFTAPNSNNLKIIDFGMSKFTQSRHYMKKLVGTLFYIAPEVFQQRYTFHCDMWSVGVVMFIMLFGFPPFHGSSDALTKRRIIAGFTPEVKNGWGAFFPRAFPVSSEAKDLMRRLLMSDPALRLSAVEALQHPWLRDPNGNDNTPLSTVILSNLKDFRAQCKFKQVVLSALSSALDDQDSKDLERAFMEFDKDGDGVLTAAELKEALAKTASSNEELEAKVKELMALDVDGDGSISLKELVMASVQKSLAAKEDRLYNVFQALDLNRDGKISADELGQALGAYIDIFDTNPDELLSEVDANGDGEIDYDEFVRLFIGREAQAQGLVESSKSSEKSSGKSSEKSSGKSSEKSSGKSSEKSSKQRG